MISLSKLNGWQRLWVLSAIVWAIPVIAFTVIALPTKTESEIYMQWANEKVDLFRKYHGQNETLIEYRRRLYGNATDKEIVHPAADRLRQFDPSTAVPESEIDAIDKKYESRLAQLERQSPVRTAFGGFLIWALPLIAIYLVGIGVHWVYVGFRSRST